MEASVTMWAARLNQSREKLQSLKAQFRQIGDELQDAQDQMKSDMASLLEAIAVWEANKDRSST
jgi:hypothetical protein